MKATADTLGFCSRVFERLREDEVAGAIFRYLYPAVAGVRERWELQVIAASEFLGLVTGRACFQVRPAGERLDGLMRVTGG